MAVEHDEDDFLPETHSFMNRVPFILAIMVGVITGLAFAFIGNCGMEKQMTKSDYSYLNDTGMDKNLVYGSFKSSDTHITNKQWDLIKAIELSDYTPKFEGTTKQEAAYYINKYKCFLPRSSK